MDRRTVLKLAAWAASGIAPDHLRAEALRKLAKARVLIVGGGFAGACCALHLRRLVPSLRVVLIDADADYVTCPMSNEVLAGRRGMDSITVSRHGLERAGVKFLRARVSGIDGDSRLLRLGDGSALPYDRLVFAGGIRFLRDRLEGYDQAAEHLMPHAWQAGEQTRILAGRLREMRDGGIFAISVPAGPMRCPPGPFERASLVAGFFKQHKPRSKILIFDANNRFPKQGVFTRAWHQFYPGMIEWIPMTQDGTVVGVDAERKLLYTAHGRHRVDVANVIPPQAPAALAPAAGLALAHGWCPVNQQTFASSNLAHVYVIGDSCIAGAMPKAASAATAQARQCARAIVADLAGKPANHLAMQSVCYSMLTPDSALAIHASFKLDQGVLRGVHKDAAAVKTPGFGVAQAAEAAHWYRRIRAEAFAA